MVRKLKYHEQKLLRKTDFITYKQDNDHRDKAVIRRYMIQKPEDYHKYNRLCGVRYPSAPRPSFRRPSPRVSRAAARPGKSASVQAQRTKQGKGTRES